MYSNQSLYYLEQLGITPWVRRSFSLQYSPQLLIFIPEVLPLSAKKLLDNLLDFLDLKTQEFRIIPINKQTPWQDSEGNQKIALIFGESLLKFLQFEAKAKIVSPDLVLLIQQPLEKKALLTPLMQLKQSISGLT